MLSFVFCCCFNCLVLNTRFIYLIQCVVISSSSLQYSIYTIFIYIYIYICSNIYLRLCILYIYKYRVSSYHTSENWTHNLWANPKWRKQSNFWNLTVSLGFLSFVGLSFFNFFMYAAVWLFTQLPYLFIIHQPHLPYISLLLCSPPPSLARSFASFCFSYISHIFCVVSQINYMRCFMRCHNSISCTFFVF